jgi:hypothetical protein
VKAALPLLLAILCSRAPPALAEEQPAPEAPRAEKALPWKRGVEYRYVWIREGRKAGETRFGIEEHSKDSRPYHVITAMRTYDWEGNSQRARSTTTLGEDGAPLAFDEALEMSGIQNVRAHQTTEIRLADRKARVKYVLNGKEETPRTLELDMPAGAFLCANQAVEHWAVFASRLPRAGGRQVLQILYPDHSKVLRVAFEKAGEEKIKLGGDEAAASRFRFDCPEARLAGSVWLDAEGRLLQVEFQGTEKAPVLRVVLEKKP